MYDNDYKEIIMAQQGNEKSFERVINDNRGFVYSIAKRFQDRGYEIEDLNQIGNIGLIKAIKNFDTSYSVKLSTYSVPYIIRRN